MILVTSLTFPSSRLVIPRALSGSLALTLNIIQLHRHGGYKKLTPRADWSEQASSRGNVNIVGIGCVAVFVLIVTIIARVAIVFFHIQEIGVVHSDTGVVALGSIAVPFAVNGGRNASSVACYMLSFLCYQ